MRCLVTAPAGFSAAMSPGRCLIAGPRLVCFYTGKARMYGSSSALRSNIVRGDIHAPASYREAVFSFCPRNSRAYGLDWRGAWSPHDPLQGNNVDATLCSRKSRCRRVRHILNAGSQAEYGPLNNA